MPLRPPQFAPGAPHRPPPARGPPGVRGDPWPPATAPGSAPGAPLRSRDGRSAGASRAVRHSTAGRAPCIVAVIVRTAPNDMRDRPHARENPYLLGGRTMRRLVITIFVAASLVGCSETGPSPSPAASRTAISTPVTVVTPSPDAPMTPSPTASPSAVPTPSPTASPSSLPTLTPLSKPSQGRGTWTKVKGSALVSPHAVAVRAGDVGVLLLGIDDYPCQTPERNAAGTPAAFYDARTHAIRRVSGDLKLELRAAASLPDGRVMVAGGTDPRGTSSSRRDGRGSGTRGPGSGRRVLR